MTQMDQPLFTYTRDPSLWIAMKRQPDIRSGRLQIARMYRGLRAIDHQFARGLFVRLRAANRATLAGMVEGIMGDV